MIPSATGLDNCLKCIAKFRMEGRYYCPVVKKFLIIDYYSIPVRDIKCSKIMLDKYKTIM